MLFIDSSPTSSQNNKRLVRSHVSKLNRKRRKVSIEHKEQKRAIIRQVRPATRLSTTESEAIGLANQDGEQLDSATLHLDARLSRLDPADLEIEDQPSRSTSPTVLSVRSVSPYFGALRTTAFSNDADFSASESADYCEYWRKSVTRALCRHRTMTSLTINDIVLRVILPNAFLPTQEWFRVFCEEPIVFHGFTAVCKLHKSFSNSHASRIQKHRMLMHWNTATHHLNEKLAYLSQEDIEPVMLCMFTLYPNDEAIREASQIGPGVFVAHMPWADHINIYVGGEPERHRRAVAWLVQRAGGIERLKLPGLPKATAT